MIIGTVFNVDGGYDCRMWSVNHNDELQGKHEQHNTNTYPRTSLLGGDASNLSTPLLSDTVRFLRRNIVLPLPTGSAALSLHSLRVQKEKWN